MGAKQPRGMFGERLPVVALQRRQFLTATDQGSPEDRSATAWPGAPLFARLAG
jgi:hypothetical protein